MDGARQPEPRRDVACPFCGLACDDLVVATVGGRPEVRANGCALGVAGFARPPGAAGPRVDGRETDLAGAATRAAEILAASRLPLFAGLGTDIAGMRAVMRLAERVGGVVDHLGSDGLFRNLRAIQDGGWVATTLSEVRNRADVLLVVGPDPSAAFPRFAERCLTVAETLFTDGPLRRRLFRLGPPPADGLAATLLPCALDALPGAVTVLRALVNDRPVTAAEGGGVPIAALRELATALTAAAYGVVAWAAAGLDDAGGALAVQAVVDLVRDLNRTTRCAGLPLTGADNLIGVNQVCTWQSGFPLRTGFGRGFPEHDAYLFSAQRLLESGEADALVWISAFRPLPPPARDVPTVVLAAPETQPAPPAAVFVPVGTPGLDHAGQVFRTDGVVALPLGQLVERGLPSVAAVLTRIDAALARREPAT